MATLYLVHVLPLLTILICFLKLNTFNQEKLHHEFHKLHFEFITFRKSLFILS